MKPVRFMSAVVLLYILCQTYSTGLAADLSAQGENVVAETFDIENAAQKGGSSCLGYTTQHLSFGSGRMRVVLGDQSGKGSDSCRASRKTAEPTFFIEPTDPDEAVSIFELLKHCLTNSACGMDSKDVDLLRKILQGRKLAAIRGGYGGAYSFSFFACLDYRSGLEECSIVGFKYKDGMASDLVVHRIMDLD